MRFFKNRPKADNAATDRLAERLAGAIIQKQQNVADRLNRLVNERTAAGRLVLLRGFCIGGCLALAASVWFSLQGGGAAFQQPQKAAAHIGRVADAVPHSGSQRPVAPSMYSPLKTVKP